MKNSDKRPKIIISDSEKTTIDKEMLKKALSNPENMKKILETNQRIMKELNLETDKSSIIENGGVKCWVINKDEKR